jgi:hypothetical protein
MRHITSIAKLFLLYIWTNVRLLPLRPLHHNDCCCIPYLPSDTVTHKIQWTALMKHHVFYRSIRVTEYRIMCTVFHFQPDKNPKFQINIILLHNQRDLNDWLSLFPKSDLSRVDTPPKKKKKKQWRCSVLLPYQDSEQENDSSLGITSGYVPIKAIVCSRAREDDRLRYWIPGHPPVRNVTWHIALRYTECTHLLDDITGMRRAVVICEISFFETALLTTQYFQGVASRRLVLSSLIFEGSQCLNFQEKAVSCRIGHFDHVATKNSIFPWECARITVGALLFWTFWTLQFCKSNKVFRKVNLSVSVGKWVGTHSGCSEMEIQAKGKVLSVHCMKTCG